jgi:hypothetical protein
MANEETYTYEDSDGVMIITVGEESIEFRYDVHGDISTVSIFHYPHDLESFSEFLLEAGRECQIEFARQEIIAMSKPQTKL